MEIAFIYFPDFTLLDVVGVYDALWRLRDLNIIPSLAIDSHAYHASSVVDTHGLTPPSLLLRKPLNSYDLVFVPGGKGHATTALRRRLFGVVVRCAGRPIDHFGLYGKFATGLRTTMNAKASENSSPRLPLFVIATRLTTAV